MVMYPRTIFWEYVCEKSTGKVNKCLAGLLNQNEILQTSEWVSVERKLKIYFVTPIRCNIQS